MTKTEFIAAVADKLDGNYTKRDTAEAVQAIFDTMADAIRTESKFSYPGFGTFKVRERGERQGRNPQTKEVITIAASKNVAFKATPKFKESL